MIYFSLDKQIHHHLFFFFGPAKAVYCVEAGSFFTVQMLICFFKQISPRHLVYKEPSFSNWCRSAPLRCCFPSVSQRNTFLWQAKACVRFVVVTQSTRTTAVELTNQASCFRSKTQKLQLNIQNTLSARSHVGSRCFFGCGAKLR